MSVNFSIKCVQITLLEWYPPVISRQELSKEHSVFAIIVSSKLLVLNPSQIIRLYMICVYLYAMFNFISQVFDIHCVLATLQLFCLS
jgi:hypothetical protein